MSNITNINGDVSTTVTSSQINHELTMLYLQNQDLSKLSISEIAQKYTDTKNEFKKAFKEQKSKNVYFV